MEIEMRTNQPKSNLAVTLLGVALLVPGLLVAKENCVDTQAAMALFSSNAEIQASVRQLKDEEFNVGSPGVTVTQLNYGDEGCFVSYLVTLPAEKGATFRDKRQELVAAVVVDSGMGWSIHRVERQDLSQLTTALRSKR